MSSRSLSEITHNACVKWYPDGSTEITCSRYKLFRERGWEETRKRVSSAPAEPSDAGENARRAVRRARSRLRDYARSNEFTHFVTLTLAPDKVPDRHDLNGMVKLMRTWLDNHVRRHGLKYILVPEHHKDGAIHFHGLVNDALPLVDSGTLANGGKPRRPRSEKQRAALLSEGWHVVYNMPSWKYGFSTAIELYGEREHAVAYVCKYIGKEMSGSGGSRLPAKIGGRWYYSGGALRLPEITAVSLDFDAFLGDYPKNAWSMSGGDEPDMVRLYEQGGHDLDRWMVQRDALQPSDSGAAFRMLRDSEDTGLSPWG